MDTLSYTTYIGTQIATVVVAVCVWVLIIAWLHDILHRFLSSNVADNKRRVDHIQTQIDDLKRELEEMKRKE